MNGIASFADDEMVALGQRIADTAASLDAGIHRLLTDLRRSTARAAGRTMARCRAPIG